jgi:hypothetical protein
LNFQNVTIPAYLQNAEYSPRLDQQGSQPVTWSISPALPACLELDSSSGLLRQVPNTPPTPLAATSFQITAQNAVGQASATFTLQIS